MKSPHRAILAIASLALLGLDPFGSGPARARAAAPEPSRGGYASLAELNSAYARQARELDHRRVADLSALAARLKGDEAAPAYRELFSVAIARDLFGDAEEGAKRY